jgi:hypothetical protein
VEERKGGDGRDPFPKNMVKVVPAEVFVVGECLLLDSLRQTCLYVANRGAQAGRCPDRCLRRSDSVAASVAASVATGEEHSADEKIIAASLALRKFIPMKNELSKSFRRAVACICINPRRSLDAPWPRRPVAP